MTQEIEELLGRVALEDRRAMGALYDRCAPKLFGICLGVLEDRAAAEDALQECFVKVWRHADRYAPNGLSPMTWLIAIARNTAIDALRARQRTARSADLDEVVTLPAPGPGPEGAAIAASEARRVQDCMDELDENRRVAVRGAYLQGFSYAELAEAAGVPINTMRTWLRRSLIKLKECLER